MKFINLNTTFYKILLVLSFSFLNINVGVCDWVDPNLYKSWSFDPGPDPRSKVGKGYIDIFSDIPNLSGLSRELKNGVKFRSAFGPTYYRGRTQKNSVKVLVIGQDGTHIAEAAGKTFTGGTGGRMQNVLDYLGINRSYFFINTFAYTIKEQYGDWAPYVRDRKLTWGRILNDEAFLLSQDLESPLVKWRNRLIEHIIESNKDSLKLIITVGGAAEDTLATFIKSRGGSVAANLNKDNAKDISAIEYKKVYAGGNRTFSYPVDNNGYNLLVRPGDKFDAKNSSMTNKLVSNAKDNSSLLKKIVYKKGGYQKTGFLDPGQLGYNLYDTYIDGNRTNSLKGLGLEGGKLKSDVRFISVPHPGSVGNASGGDRGALIRSIEDKFQRKLSILKDFKKEGWDLPEDPYGENKLFKGLNFKYSRKSLPSADFPLGLSNALIVDKSLASRVSGMPNAIEFGGRDRGKYSKEEVYEADRGELKSPIDRGDNAWEPPRKQRYNFDRGPNIKYSRLLTNLDVDKIFKQARSNIKSHPNHSYFAPYRGTFDNPQIVIVADDTDDLDGLFSARALTNKKGQRLQAFLEGLGVSEDYLIIKTIPFDMGENKDDYKKVYNLTKKWRTDILKEVAETERPKLFLALGDFAEDSIKSIDSNIPMVRVKNSYWNTYQSIAKLPYFKKKNISYKSGYSNIPRSHLPFGKQAWVGTSGDRVIGARDERCIGLLYRVFVPSWASNASRYSPKPLNSYEKYFIRYAKAKLNR